MDTPAVLFYAWLHDLAGNAPWSVSYKWCVRMADQQTQQNCDRGINFKSPHAYEMAIRVFC